MSARIQPLFMRGEYCFDFDAMDMAHQYTAVIRVKSDQQAGTGFGNVALGVCPAGEVAFGIVQMNGPVGQAAAVMQMGVSPARISTDAAAGKMGDYLAVGANGCLVKAAAGAFAVAQADEDYSPGALCTVTVFPFGKQ